MVSLVNHYVLVCDWLFLQTPLVQSEQGSRQEESTSLSPKSCLSTWSVTTGGLLFSTSSVVAVWILMCDLNVIWMHSRPVTTCTRPLITLFRLEVDFAHFSFWLCAICCSLMCHVCWCGFRFVEYGEYKGHLYGISTDAIDEVLKRGRICIVDVEPHVSFFHFMSY